MLQTEHVPRPHLISLTRLPVFLLIHFSTLGSTLASPFKVRLSLFGTVYVKESDCEALTLVVHIYSKCVSEST